MPNKIEIAARLRTARKMAGYKTLKQFCEKHNIPTSTYSQHETGTRKAKEKILRHYTDLLEVSYDWVLYGLGEPFANTQDSEHAKELFHRELKKITPRLAMDEFDKTLFADILSSFFVLQRHLSPDVDPKLISYVLIEIYEDIVSTTEDPITRRKLVDTMLKPYIKLLQKSS